MNYHDEIIKLKKLLAGHLVILGHNYQRQEIINVSDLIGDSYYLAKTSAQQKGVKYIVFCGVRFMAEAAAILCGQNQKVLHPDAQAGCPLADSANYDDVTVAWEELAKVIDINQLMPLTYINSGADLKAFCGSKGGLVCTSSNAMNAMKYGFKKAKKLFFFPDQHLGRNTAAKMGIEPDEMVVFRPSEELGSNSKKDIEKAKIILWDGYCHVHTFFKPQHVEDVRKKYPGVKVVVHPECPQEVVKLSDETGSTGFIADYVKNAPKGSTVAVGTEINLVSRLAKENPDKTVIELKRSLCPTMYRITPEKLYNVIANIESFEHIELPEEIRNEAALALKRMLEV